jgi:hypothetical protein
MNPEPAPETMTRNPPEAPAVAGRTAETGEVRPEKKPGLLIRFVRWFDRGLDLEGRDTSDWNIYYYYFRQVAQHRALLKLKYLKWFALAFQLYFFGTIVFAVINGILALDALKTSGQGEGFGGLAIFAFLGLGVAGLASNLVFLLPLLFLPVLMVAPAFRLRSKNRALITSRAKDPPLLAHLVQYTSNKGLVQGALQSLLYTWKRLLILLSPCLVPILLILALGAVSGIASGKLTVTELLTSALTPVGAVLCVMAISLFFLMQPFCYRLDSLMVAICIGIETIMFFGIIVSPSTEDFLAFFAVYAVSCLFAIVYFPLAAADTGELGLGKRTSRWIRILLYTTAGVFLAILLSANAFLGVRNTSYSSSGGELFELLFLFVTLGLSVSVCGLLVTSLSVTSPLAERQIQTRTKEPFLRKLFDPASPLSLLPVIALELITLATVFILFQLDIRTGSYHDVVGTLILYSCGSRARNAWTAIHFALAFSYIRQRKKMEMKAPWDFNVRFNLTCLVSYVAIQLLLALTTGKGAGFVGIVLYIVSIIVLFTAFGFLKSPASTYKIEAPEAQEQDKEEAS